MQDLSGVENLDYKSLETLETYIVMELDTMEQLEIIFNKRNGKFYRVINYYDPKLVEVLKLNNAWVEKDN